MKKYTHTIFLFFLVVLLVSCAGSLKPVYNVKNHPLNGTAQKLSLKQIANVIFTSGMRRNWVMEEIDPGVIRATLRVRSHTAVIDIKYRKSDYSIEYVSSVDLKYNGTLIHRNYNRWLTNLVNDINREFNAVGIRSIKQ
jgi:PBP1b-binding outer membrane lipoprotein LpoB